MTSSTQEPDLANEGDVIKERFKIVKKLGGGGFGEIYECTDCTNNMTVAIKLESSKLPKQVLRMEVSVLKKLQGCKHACKCFGYGRNDKYSYVAMTLQGKNLADLRRQMRNACFSVSTTMQLTLQILQSIENIHQIGFLHRDIKPSNFAMGLAAGTTRIVYMLDFGLARQYVMPGTTTAANKDGNVELEVRPPREAAGFRGTVRYASVNAHNNVEMGRHDDLWSAFYMIVEMLTGQLPWRRMKDKEQVGQMKHNYDHTRLLTNLPQEMKGFLAHIQDLDYFRKPDYAYLYQQIRDCMDRKSITMTDPYDWEIPNNPASIGSVTGAGAPATGTLANPPAAMATSTGVNNAGTNAATAAAAAGVITANAASCPGDGGGDKKLSTQNQAQHQQRQQNNPTTSAATNYSRGHGNHPDDVSNNNLNKIKHRGESVMKIKKHNNQATTPTTNNSGSAGALNSSDNNNNHYHGDNQADNISASAKSSYRNNNTAGVSKSDKSGRASMPPLSPRSAFSSQKDRKVEAKFTEDLDNTPRGCHTDATTAGSTRESHNTNRRNRHQQQQQQLENIRQLPNLLKTINNEDKSAPQKSRQPQRPKSISSRNPSTPHQNNHGSNAPTQLLQDQQHKHTTTISSSTSNLPPKPIGTPTTTATSKTKRTNHNNNGSIISGLNYNNLLMSIGGSVATNAVNDEQFDVSNAPDATKAVHLTQMSNQGEDDDDDVDDGINLSQDDNYYEASNHALEKIVKHPEELIKQPIKIKPALSANENEDFVTNERIKSAGSVYRNSRLENDRSVSIRNEKSTSNANKQSIAKIQAQLTDKSRAASSIQSRLANNSSGDKDLHQPNSGTGSSCGGGGGGGDEDTTRSSNYGGKSKESHELEITTFSKARTSTSGYVSGPVGDIHHNTPSTTSASNYRSSNKQPRSSSGGSTKNNTGLPPRVNSISSGNLLMGPTGDLSSCSPPPQHKQLYIPQPPSVDVHLMQQSADMNNYPVTPRSQKNSCSSTNNYYSRQRDKSNDQSDVSISKSSKRTPNQNNPSSASSISQKERSKAHKYHQNQFYQQQQQQQSVAHHNFQNNVYTNNQKGDHKNQYAVTINTSSSSQNHMWNRPESHSSSGYHSNHMTNSRHGYLSTPTNQPRPTPKPRSQRSQNSNNSITNNSPTPNTAYRSPSVVQHETHSKSGVTRVITQQRSLHRSSSRDSLNTSLNTQNQQRQRTKFGGPSNSPSAQQQQQQQQQQQHKRRSTSFCSSTDSIHRCGTSQQHPNANNSTATTTATINTGKHYSKYHHHHNHHHPQQQPDKSINELISRVNYYAPTPTPVATTINNNNNNNNCSIITASSPKRSLSINRSQSADLLSQIVKKRSKTATKSSPNNNNNNNSELKYGHTNTNTSMAIGRKYSSGTSTTANNNKSASTLDRHAYKKVKRPEESNHHSSIYHNSRHHYRPHSSHYTRSKSNNDDELTANSASHRSSGPEFNHGGDDEGDENDAGMSGDNNDLKLHPSQKTAAASLSTRHYHRSPHQPQPTQSSSNHRPHHVNQSPSFVGKNGARYSYSNHPATPSVSSHKNTSGKTVVRPKHYKHN